jgi:acyl carrier protein
MDRQTELLNYVKEELLHGRKVELRADEDLLSSGIVDSLGILKLVGFVEDHFGIQVPDEDVVHENFHSIQALSSYLQKF